MRVIQVHLTGSPTCIHTSVEEALEEIRLLVQTQFDDEAPPTTIIVLVSEISEEAYANLDEHQGY